MKKIRLLLLLSISFPLLANKTEDDLRAQLAAAQKEKASLAAALSSMKAGTKALEAGQKSAAGERKAAATTAEASAVEAKGTADATLQMAVQAADSSDAARTSAETAKQQNITLIIMQAFGLLGIVASGLLTIYGKKVMSRLEGHAVDTKIAVDAVAKQTDGMSTALIAATRSNALREGHDQGAADAIGLRPRG